MSPQDSAVLTELLCEFRRSHPDWGARKLLKVLRGRHPEIEDWPAASTTSDLLARRGLVRKRRRRHPHQHPGVVPISTAAPNDLWTADFKGQFRTGNGVYCYPLTIADQHTRFLLTCHGLHFLVKKVTDAGTFRFQKRLLYLANSLVDQHIGLEETDDGVWSIYFNTILLATLDERDYIIRG
jgi:transposase InsO family protein